MDTQNTTTNPTPAAVPQTPMESPQMPPMQNSGGNGWTKILVVILLIAVIIGSGVGAMVMYKQMKANAAKKPATNYVVEDSNGVSPTTAEPTVPPVLSQPVAKDASGIDNEIKILDQTASGTDSTTVKTQDIQNVTK